MLVVVPQHPPPPAGSVSPSTRNIHDTGIAVRSRSTAMREIEKRWSSGTETRSGSRASFSFKLRLNNVDTVLGTDGVEGEIDRPGARPGRYTQYITHSIDCRTIITWSSMRHAALRMQPYLPEARRGRRSADGTFPSPAERRPSRRRSSASVYMHAGPCCRVRCANATTAAHI